MYVVEKLAKEAIRNHKLSLGISNEISEVGKSNSFDMYTCYMNA